MLARRSLHSGVKEKSPFRGSLSFAPCGFIGLRHVSEAPHVTVLLAAALGRLARSLMLASIGAKECFERLGFWGGKSVMMLSLRKATAQRGRLVRA